MSENVVLICGLFCLFVHHNVRRHFTFTSAAYASDVNRYMKTKEITICNVNSDFHFNLQCIKGDMTPRHEKFKILNTSLILKRTEIRAGFG